VLSADRIQAGKGQKEHLGRHGRISQRAKTAIHKRRRFEGASPSFCVAMGGVYLDVFYCADRPPLLPKRNCFENFARVAKALASANRLELLEALAQGERSVDWSGAQAAAVVCRG